MSPCILGVISLEIQRPNSDWLPTAVGQTKNWGVKPWWKSMNQISTKKLIEQGIQWNNFKWIGLKIKMKYFFRNQQKRDQIWAKCQNFWFLNSNYLSKSNLNYLNCKDYKGITILTQLTRSLSFKFLWLLRIHPISFSSCFRCSRGESKHFLPKFRD